MVKKTKKNDNVNECLTCGAICCRNLSLSIGKPVTKSEKEDLKWQLHFDTVKVYIRSNRWYQQVDGNCIYLNKKNRCTIYEKRPDKCRKHNPPDCELYGKYYDTMFTRPEELEEYFKKQKKKRKK